MPEYAELLGLASAEEASEWFNFQRIYMSTGNRGDTIDSYRQRQRSKEYWEEVFELFDTSRALAFSNHCSGELCQSMLELPSTTER